MSALGQKQTSRHLQPMSALPPKADIETQSSDVRRPAGIGECATIGERRPQAVMSAFGTNRTCSGFTTQFQRPIQLAIWICVTGLAAAQYVELQRINTNPHFSCCSGVCRRRTKFLSPIVGFIQPLGAIWACDAGTILLERP